MNVPLKKRYNYCAIDNNENSTGSINFTNGKRAISPTISFRKPDNNNFELSNLNGINIVKQTENVNNRNFTKLIQPTQQASATKELPIFHSPLPPKSQQGDKTTASTTIVAKPGQTEKPPDEQIQKAIFPSTSPSVISITSSSLAATSLASNKSLALSEINEEQCKRQSEPSTLPTTNDDCERLSNGCLTENSIRLIELRNPPMTTRERVMNWRLSPDFIRVEDNLDDSRYDVPLRSERLQNLQYKVPIKIRDTFHTAAVQNNLVNSSKRAKSLGCIERSPSTSSSGTSSIYIQSSNPSSSPDNYPRKRQLLPPDSPARNHFQEKPSAITLRFDYSTTQQQQQVIKEKNEKSARSENFKVPTVPVERNTAFAKSKRKKINIPKKKSNKKPIIAHEPKKATISCEVPLGKKTPAPVVNEKSNQSSKSNSNQEEFYKYLGIDTNPSHEKSPGSSAPDSTLHEGHRRSLRVRIQQNATKIAEMNDKERESMNVFEKPNLCTDVSPKTSKAAVVKQNNTQNLNQKSKISETKKNVSNVKTPEKDVSTKGNTSQQLVKISYIKPNTLTPTNSSTEKKYKAICLLPSNKRPTSSCSDCLIVGETLLPPIEKDNSQSNLKSFIVDRRFYDSGAANDSERFCNARPYTSKVLIESNNTVSRRATNNLIKTEQEIVLVTTENLEDETTTNVSSLTMENAPENYDAQIQQMETESITNLEEIPTFTTCLDDANSEQNSSEVEILCTTSTALVSDYEIRNILGIPYAVPRLKRFVPKPSEMLRRYKRCLRQSIALKTRLKYQQQQRRRQIEKRLKILNNSKEKSNDEPASDVLMEIDNTSYNEVNNSNDLVQTSAAEMSVLITTSTAVQSALLLPYDENDAFSPTSLTHSNASTDSAIVVSSKNDVPSLTTVLSKTNTNFNSFEPSSSLHGVISSPAVQHNVDRSSDIRYTKNSLNLDTNEPIKAAMVLPQTMSVSAAIDTLIVVQKSRISFWQMTPRYLNMLGVSRSLELIAETKRYLDDIEVEALYQNRIIKDEDNLPIYIEVRARQSEPNEYRQCCLSSVYVNIYRIKSVDEKEPVKKPKIGMQSVQLETIKGYASTLIYLIIQNSPNIVMCWTEMLVNRTRSCLCKYSLFAPEYDEIKNILDFACVQQPIKSLHCLNENHIIGCGENSVSMWNHQTGGLVINIDMNIATIGDNIGGLLMDGADTEYLLIIQLIPSEIEQQMLKLITIDLAHSHNWRIVHSHHIPNHYKTIISSSINGDLLTVTFDGGYSFLINLFYPQNVYLHETDVELSSQNNQIDQIRQDERTSSNRAQVFVQNNGQILEISNEYLLTKLAWEYFMQK